MILMSFEKIPFMSVKMRDLRIDQIEKLSSRYALYLPFSGQNTHQVTGPNHEKIAILSPDGNYQVELPENKQTEETILKAIMNFREYAGFLNPE